jgi:hypothetical protein
MAGRRDVHGCAQPFGFLPLPACGER